MMAELNLRTCFAKVSCPWNIVLMCNDLINCNKFISVFLTSSFFCRSAGIEMLRIRLNLEIDSGQNSGGSVEKLFHQRVVVIVPVVQLLDLCKEFDLFDVTMFQTLLRSESSMIPSEFSDIPTEWP